MEHERWMRLAIEQARLGVSGGQSPFGAVVVRAGELLAAAHNQVRADLDATAHAEVLCIRRACARLGRVHLEDCVIYSSCEPCPMCAAACHWARLAEVRYGASIADATAAGFNELELPIEELYRRTGSPLKVVRGPLVEECQELFRSWLRRPGSEPY